MIVCWRVFSAWVSPVQIRDVTPEAVRPLIHRPAIGLVVAMMTYGLQVSTCQAAVTIAPLCQR